MAESILRADQVRKVFYVYNDPAAGTTELSSRKQWNLFGRRKSFELVALDGASLEVNQNELVALLGPSGCGKSTLLRIWAGLETATTGRVEFKGQPITGPDPQRAMVFQSERAVFPWLTVEKNIELGPKLQGVPRAERQQRVRDVVKLIQLNGFNKAYPATLSGGMLQRVAVGRAMINRPQVLLMDEPFGALDAQTRATLQDHLIRIWQETQQTIVFVTHDIEEATYLATRIAVLTARPGKIKGVVPVPLAHPRSRTDAAFVETRKKVATLLEGG
jgi:ABC-type nitrate/sulfonate/bicarbonate transport system ATPase subunit